MGFFTLASTASPVAPEGVLEADTWKTSLQLEYYLICNHLYPPIHYTVPVVGGPSWPYSWTCRGRWPPPGWLQTAPGSCGLGRSKKYGGLISNHRWKINTEENPKVVAAGLGDGIDSITLHCTSYFASGWYEEKEE